MADFEFATYLSFNFKAYVSIKIKNFLLPWHTNSVDFEQDDFWNCTEKENDWLLQTGQSDLEKLYYTIR